MPTIQQPGREAKPFIKLETRDKECRCCGKGTVHVCDSCNEKLHDGYAFFLEVKDTSNEAHKKPTGYAIAFKAAGVYENGHPDVALTAGIYFIRESDLKQFLGNGYNNGKSSSGKFLNNGAKWRTNPNRPSAGSSRSATELVDR